MALRSRIKHSSGGYFHKFYILIPPWRKSCFCDLIAPFIHCLYELMLSAFLIDVTACPLGTVANVNARPGIDTRVQGISVYIMSHSKDEAIEVK
jgi:hypothetical protein